MTRTVQVTFDCADPDCAGTPMCGVCTTFEICGNGADDDCNGLIDEGDPGSGASCSTDRPC